MNTATALSGLSTGMLRILPLNHSKFTETKPDSVLLEVVATIYRFFINIAIFQANVVHEFKKMGKTEQELWMAVHLIIVNNGVHLET